MHTLSLCVSVAISFLSCFYLLFLNLFNVLIMAVNVPFFLFSFVLPPRVFFEIAYLLTFLLFLSFISPFPPLSLSLSHTHTHIHTCTYNILIHTNTHIQLHKHMHPTNTNIYSYNIHTHTHTRTHPHNASIHSGLCIECNQWRKAYPSA